MEAIHGDMVLKMRGHMANLAEIDQVLLAIDRDLYGSLSATHRLMNAVMLVLGPSETTALTESYSTRYSLGKTRIEIDQKWVTRHVSYPLY